MLTCIPLYKKASISDKYYVNISNGYLKTMTQYWGIDYITDDGYELFNSIFKPENNRINIDDIINHTYLQI